MRVALGAIAAAVLSSGCSWIFVERAPPNHQQLPAFDCTSSVAAPVLDVIWGSLNLLGAVNAAGSDDRTWSGPGDRSATIAVGVGWAVVSGLAAGYGFTHTNQCRQAKDNLYARLSRANPSRLAAGGPFGTGSSTVARPPANATPPGARPVAAAAATETPAGGCQKDIDCKGDRICERHECVSPYDAQGAALASATETADLSPASSPPAALSRTDAQVALSRPAPREVSGPGCAPLGTAVVLAGADIHSGPDPTTRTLTTVDRKTSVCAGVERQGFGYRVVQLVDGTSGFVHDSYFSDLVGPPPTALPAVATARPSVLPVAPARMAPAACAPLVPALALEGATIHAGPDAQSRIIVTLRVATPVCATTASQGFGFRRVKFADATGGFIKDSSLSE